VGARLAEAGQDVTFVARGEHLRAIRERGLRLESIGGDVHVHPAIATDDPSEIGSVDAVVVATKTWQLPEAAKAMRPMIGPGTTVVPVLNGVEAPEVLAEILGREVVVGGLCGMTAFIAAPGVIRHVGADPWVAFGELDGTVS
jgi:2-dehydropantoate 2-reductase